MQRPPQLRVPLEARSAEHLRDAGHSDNSPNCHTTTTKVSGWAGRCGVHAPQSCAPHTRPASPADGEGQCSRQSDSLPSHSPSSPPSPKESSDTLKCQARPESARTPLLCVVDRKAHLRSRDGYGEPAGSLLRPRRAPRAWFRSFKSDQCVNCYLCRNLFYVQLVNIYWTLL